MSAEKPHTSSHFGEVRRAMVAVFTARVGVNAGIRVVFPFLPVIARGLGTTLSTMGVLIALRSLVGLTAPVSAHVAGHVGRRTVMVGGLVATGIGCALIGLAPGLLVAAVGFVLVGLGKPGFDVPMQAWFGARVPYARRGRVLGIIELTWAGGLLASVPLSGWLIERTSWRAPFALVFVLVLLGVVAVLALMDDDRPRERAPVSLVLTRPRVAMLAVVLLFSLAAEGLFVVYGAWLEQDLGLDVTAIGIFTLVVVASELTGEGSVAAFGDRVGLRRLVRLALLASAVAYASLPLVGGNLAGAVVVVVGWFISFEITIVATTPFMTELGGTGRDKLMGYMVAAIAVGRAAGAIAGPRLFEAAGITPIALAAAGAVGLAWALTLLVPEPDASSGAPATPG